MLAVLLAAALDLHLDYTRQSLTATYRHYSAPGAEVIERTDPNSTIRTTHPRRPMRRVVTRNPRPVARDFDAETGELLREVPLFFNVKGRVFEVNPVSKLNAPELRDRNDATSAVPEPAYSIVDLPELTATGTLVGPNVRIVDPQSPNTPRADAAQSLLFDRGQPQFEEVNVYYLIDRTQRYLQSLGFTGAKRLVAYPIAVDPHALNGSDNSVYETSSVSGQGVLFFGDGGTDDAEDSDIVIHEYTHAIQDWIAPGAFFGTSASESRALAEGIADYWAFSQTYAPSVASGRDPYCLGEWDARCDGDDPSQLCGYPPSADCLRRVDSTKTFADFKALERAGQEHENGAIWSSALREMFESLVARHPSTGAQTSDKIVIESLFGTPTSPTFAVMGQQLVRAARSLAPNDVDLVCGAMRNRGIAVADCIPRGELTMFQSSTTKIVITDPRTIERLTVVTDVAGVLVAPDGTRVALNDTASLHGRSAAGIWTLEVTSGVLRSWSLVIQFTGAAPLAARPSTSALRKHIAAVAHAAGSNGTNWITDVRIFNRGLAVVNATVVYTPDAGDFAAVKVVIKPQQVVALNDVVGAIMQSVGLGSLEIQGDAANLVVTSRTYTEDARGTFGQFVAGVDTSEAIGMGQIGFVTHMRDDGEFRANVGFTEVAGERGVVRVSGRDIPVAPFQHIQMPASGDTEIVVISGNARVLGYGSLIDNRSGDAIYVPVREAPEVARFEYAPAISSAGLAGTRWSTEVVVTGTEPIAVNFGSTGDTYGVITPPARVANILSDVLHRETGFGLLRLTMPAGSLASARVWTSSESGTYGQFVPFLPLSGHGGNLLQLEVSDRFRTNIGMANTGASASTGRITVFAADGTLLSDTFRLLQPLELVQVPLTIDAARVQVEASLAWASVVDNRSGDAIYIPAQ